MSIYDCVVIGSGNAGSCAALAAAEHGCKRVLMIDKCPAEWVGGNSYFTAGAHRTVHGGLADLLPIVTNVTEEMESKIDVEPYTAQQFEADIQRLSDGRSDPALVQAVVDASWETIEWLARSVKVPFTLSFNRQAYEVDGRQKFWGGMALSVRDGGEGLISAHQQALENAGVEVWLETPAVALLESKGKILGIMVEKGGRMMRVNTPAVVLAAGGFEANAKLRVTHLGPGWDKAKVRGTPHNTGECFALAQKVEAQFHGDWAGCHSTCWDANAPPDSGDRVLSNQFTKSGYPLGIMVNALGQRFVDEGEDFRNYTYAKFGRQILDQPGGYVFQVFDQQTIPWLRKEEYADDVVEKIQSDSIEGLAEKLAEKGLGDKAAFIQTVQAFNDAVQKHKMEYPNDKWDPAIKDGLSTFSSTSALTIPKSNWALPLEQPPFMAVKVACGITFTFGGLAIDPSTAGVLSRRTGEPVTGLYCVGEMVGGLFYGNYPGGSGLTAGAVFGRLAGRGAARLAAQLRS